MFLVSYLAGKRLNSRRQYVPLAERDVTTNSVSILD
jgi:hypothetical protein